VTNGRALFAENFDHRSTWVRRLKDLLSMHVADLGGEEMLSAAEHSIVRRVAALTVEMEILELRFARNGGASANGLDLYIRAAGGLRRLLEAIGMKRIPRDVTPTLSDIARDIAASSIINADPVEVDDEK
jgi:hypothetical protein